MNFLNDENMIEAFNLFMVSNKGKILEENDIPDQILLYMLMLSTI